MINIHTKAMKIVIQTVTLELLIVLTVNSIVPMLPQQVVEQVAVAIPQLPLVMLPRPLLDTHSRVIMNLPITLLP